MNDEEPLAPLFKPGKEELDSNASLASKFISALFAPYDEGYVDFRSLYPQWSEEYVRGQNRDDELWTPTHSMRFVRFPAQDVIAEYVRRHAWSKDCYFGVLPRSEKSGKLESVTQAAWLWCDIDAKQGGHDAAMGALTQAMQESSLPCPSIITDSRNGVHCVPTSTEALTRHGWVTHDALSVGDEVMGYNTEMDCLEWTRVRGIVVNDSQEVFKIGNKRRNYECSISHRWAVRNAKTKAVSLIEAGDIRQQSTVVLSSEFDCAGISITDRECAILGWVLADGSISNKMDCRVSQKDGTKSIIIEGLLDGVAGRKMRHHANSVCPEMGTWLIPRRWMRLLYDKMGLDYQSKHDTDWLSVMLRMSRNQRKIFLDSFYLADGTDNRGTRTFCQNRGKIAEAVIMGIFLSGKIPGVSQGRTNASTGKQMLAIRECRGYIADDISVTASRTTETWCPVTQLGTWVMRQGESISITGNCYWALDSVVKLHDQRARQVFTSALKGLASWIGSFGDVKADPAVTNVNAILRISGTYNLKREYEPFRVVSFAPPVRSAPKSYAWWQANIPGYTLPVEYKPREARRDSVAVKFKTTKRGHELLDNPPASNRHDALKLILGGSVYYGNGADVLDELAIQFSSASGLPQAEALRLARHFDRQRNGH